MTDTLTLTGVVATTPKHIVTSTGLAITSFRFVDGETNWYTVTCFRQLAINVLASIRKGQRIVVTGRLRVRDWATDERTGTHVELEAAALGHDLSWGTAEFTHTPAQAVAEQPAEDAEAPR